MSNVTNRSGTADSGTLEDSVGTLLSDSHSSISVPPSSEILEAAKEKRKEREMETETETRSRPAIS
jgi:hypothetical protein